MEIFACGGHLLAHKTTSSTLNSQLQSALKKQPPMSTFITKSFLGHSKSKNYRNFSPAAKRPKRNFSGLHETLSFCTGMLQSAFSRFNLKIASYSDLYYRIASKRFFVQQLSKFFACGGQLIAIKNSCLHSHFRFNN